MLNRCALSFLLGMYINICIVPVQAQTGDFMVGIKIKGLGRY